MSYATMTTLFGLPLKVIDGLTGDAAILLHPETKIDIETGQVVNASKSIILRANPAPSLRMEMEK